MLVFLERVLKKHLFSFWIVSRTESRRFILLQPFTDQERIFFFASVMGFQSQPKCWE